MRRLYYTTLWRQPRPLPVPVRVRVLRQSLVATTPTSTASITNRPPRPPYRSHPPPRTSPTLPLTTLGKLRHPDTRPITQFPYAHCRTRQHKNHSMALDVSTWFLLFQRHNRAPKQLRQEHPTPRRVPLSLYRRTNAVEPIQNWTDQYRWHPLRWRLQHPTTPGRAPRAAAAIPTAAATGRPLPGRTGNHPRPRTRGRPTSAKSSAPKRHASNSTNPLIDWPLPLIWPGRSPKNGRHCWNSGAIMVPIHHMRQPTPPLQ